MMRILSETKSDQAAYALSKPGNKTYPDKAVGQGHEAAHPDHRIPCPFFIQDVLPFQNARQYHARYAHHSYNGRVNLVKTARAPQEKTSKECRCNQLLVARHRPELIELTLSNCFGLRRIL